MKSRILISLAVLLMLGGLTAVACSNEKETKTAPIPVERAIDENGKEYEVEPSTTAEQADKEGKQEGSSEVEVIGDTHPPEDNHESNGEDELDGEEDFNPEWRTTTVDDEGWVGIDPSIAVDTNGNPHIAYYDQSNRDLKYAYSNGSSWQIETVVSTGDVGEESGIAVDSSGNPHISCNSGDKTNALIYATRSEGSWHIQTFEQPKGYHVVSTSIDLDSRGYPHIIYNIQNGYIKSGVRYTYWDGNAWQTENVHANGEDVFMAIDSSDNTHVSFRSENLDEDTNVTRLTYAKRTAGEWSVSIVDGDTRAGGDTGIAVDSDNRPHIVYRDYGNASVKYAYLDGISWRIQVVDANGGGNEGTKIAVDSSNNPHIVYSVEAAPGHEDNGEDEPDDEIELLKYAFWDGNAWSYENIAKMGNPAIAIDQQGRVHVAHNRTKEGDPLDYCPDYEGDEEEIEILKYSWRGNIGETVAKQS
ncbi:MAG: hypothetical protein ACE5KP_07685 [Dehalococcoidales bacterium]